MRQMQTALAAAMASLVLFSAPAQAVDREVPTYVLDKDLTLMNDLRTRGLSDSLMKPALKFSMQLAHETGFIALLEAVNVNKTQFPNGRGLDFTLGTGYRFGDPEAWHFGLGFAAELFPGAKVEAPHGFDLESFTPTDMRYTSYNSRFAVFEFGYGNIEGRLLDVVSKTYRGADTGTICGALLQFSADPTRAIECYARGDHNSRGSLLFDLTYKTPIAPYTTLTLHAGRQRVAHFSEANFNDYRIGLTRKQWGFEWNADWVMTRNKVREIYLTLDGDKARATDNDKLVLSVTRRF